MSDLPSLTGAQKTQLRGLGQTAPDRVWLGKDGVSPAFVTELNRQLNGHELVKLRFTAGQDRKARAALCSEVEAAGPLPVHRGRRPHRPVLASGPDEAKLLA